ncbi:hypothetical protein BGZ88_005712, partial [Linnemannia elongata]
MSSSLPQSNSLPSPPSSTPLGHPELAIEGQPILSRPEHTAPLGHVSTKSGDVPTIAQGLATIQLGPANLLSPLGHHTARDDVTDDDHGLDDASDAKSVSSDRLSKFGFRKRLSKLFKGDKKIIETASASQTSSISTTSSVPVTLVETEGHIRSAPPDHNAAPASLGLHYPADSVETVSTKLSVPTTQVPGPVANRDLRMDIFPENIKKPIYRTDLPKPHARVDKTPQLVYCCNLLFKAQGSHSSTSDSDISQDSPLDDKEKEWVQLIDPVLQDQYRWLVERLVRAFAESPLKASGVVTEIVLVAPILDRDTYRSLLSCFISKFEQTTALDVTLLQGLVQLVECASSGYLVDDDLVRIATVLSKELSITHIGTSNHPLHLTLSLGRVLDVMLAGQVKDLNRERDHQPMLQLLNSLKESDNVVQKFEATYAYQALQYASDDETPLQ